MGLGDLVFEQAKKGPEASTGFADEVLNAAGQLPQEAPQPEPRPASPYFGDIINERLATGTVNTPELKFREKWSKMPWWYRMARYPLGILDVAQLPGDLARSVLYDINAREPGQPLETLRLLSWKNLSRYAPWGDTPKYVAPGSEIAKSMGVPEDKAGIAGTALEILLDPLIILDGIAATGTRLTAREASRLTMKKLGREVFTPEEMIKAARELEDVGDTESATLIRLAARQRALGKLYSPAEWIPEPTRKAVAKGLTWALDRIPSPFSQEVAIGTSGATRRERLSILEAFINPQVGKAAKLKGTPHEEAIAKIYGRADVTKIPKGGEAEFVPSGLSLAKNYSEEIAMEVISNAREVVDIFEKYTGRSPLADKETYRLFSKWTTEWLDKLDADPAISKALMVSDKPIRSSKELRRLFDSSKFKQELYDRIKVYAAQKGLDARKLYDGVRAASMRQLQSALKVGWVVSGMPDFYKTIDKVVESTGRSPFDVSQALFKKAMGYNLNKKEEDLYLVFREFWKENGGAYATVDPLTYIKNVSNGYYRRAMGINLMNPQQVRAFVEDLASGTKWYPSSQLGADRFLSAAEKYLNPEDVDRLAGFLYAYGDGPLTPRMIEEQLGIPADKIIQAANDAQIDDLGRGYLEKLQRDLENLSGKRPKAGLFGRSVFRTRKVAEEDIENYLPLLQTEERGAALAVAAHRAISGQTLLRTVGDALDEAGLVFSRPYDPVRMVDKWGEKLMYVPEDPIFGPLAGKYIPRYAGMTIMKAVQTGDPGVYSMLLNKLRMGWLSSPNTISRNVTGGLIMMRAVGIPYTEQAKYLREAVRDVRKVYELGDPKILGEGAEYLNMYETGTLAREAYDDIETSLNRMLSAAIDKDKGRWRAAMDDLDKKVEKVIQGGPLFGYFQFSEDAMRVATFKWVRDRLLRRGYSKEEAGKAAAAAANNILFDYADQPPAIEWFRKTGLMLFPSFFGFNVGRTANIILKRPAAVQFQARLSGATQQLLDERDRELASRAAQDAWWGNEVPIMLPIPGSDDRFWVIPMRNIIPQLQALDWQGQISEPLLGGIAQRLIDAWYAHTSGEGVGPISQRYGQQVYTPGAPLGTRVYETTRYLAEGYVPSWMRTAKQSLDALLKTYRAPNADSLMQTMGKEYGFSKEFAARKLAGWPVYQKSRAGLVRDIGIANWKLQQELNDLQKRIRRADQVGDEAERERLIKYYLKLREKIVKDEQFRMEVP